MKIACPYCKKEFESKEVIDTKLVDELREELQREAESSYQKKLDAQMRASEDVYRKKLDAEILVQSKKAESEVEINKQLREQITSLFDEVKQARMDKDSAEQEVAKKLIEERESIRQEVTQKAEERHQLEIRQLEEKLRQTRVSLSEAKSRAEQGTAQQKGEALELNLEQQLKDAFPEDDIVEVKKGKRGADIVQTVRSRQGIVCGVILYECKNAKWQAAWIDKLRDDVRNASANIGVLVATYLGSSYKDVHQVDGHIWASIPTHAILLASLLRNQLIAVSAAHRNNEFKEEKMEYLHRFLTGPEFRSRVESMIQSYNKLQIEMEKEKRAAKSRWAQQEKAIRLLVDNTYGLFGDFQGLLGGELSELPESLSGGDGRSIREIIVEDLLELPED